MTSFPQPILGHAHFGEIDVAYLEVAGRDGKPLHWFLAVGNDGVTHARPLAAGSLVPDRPGASVEEVEFHLGNIVEEPGEDTDAQVVTAFRQGIRTRGDLDPMAKALQELGVPFARQFEDHVRRATRAAFAPARKRMARHVRIVEACELLNDSQAIPYPTRFLSPVGVAARILRLSASDLDGLEALGLSPLLRQALELPDVDLSAAPEAIVGNVLDVLRVPQAAVRRLPRGLTPCPAVVRAMRALPVGWMPSPTDDAEWRAMEIVALTLHGGGMGEASWPRLLSGCKGRWAAFLERCGRAAHGPDSRSPTLHVPDRLAHARDVTNGFAAFLESLDVEGLKARLAKDAIAHDATVGELNLPSILGNSRIWHARFKAPGPSGATWDPILPEWTDPATGIGIVPLSNSDDLAEEGDVMDHCVGGEAYALASLRNQVRVISLRRDGTRLSTAEIALGTPSRSRPTLHGVVQHQGARNVTPPEEAKAALASYVALEAVSTARLGAEPNDRKLPPRTQADIEALLERWRPYLTGRWKRATIEEFRQALMAQAPGIAHAAGDTSEIRSRPEGPTP